MIRLRQLTNIECLDLLHLHLSAIPDHVNKLDQLSFLVDVVTLLYRCLLALLELSQDRHISEAFYLDEHIRYLLRNNLFHMSGILFIEHDQYILNAGCLFDLI